MARKASVVVLSAEERAQLEQICKRATSEQRFVFRARIILALAEGLSVVQVSQKLKIPPKTIIKWKKRYLAQQLAGLNDRSRSGKPMKFKPTEKLRIISEACKSPSHITHWSTRELQKHLQKQYNLRLSHMTIQRTLKAADLKPQHVEMWLDSSDPDFEAKQLAIIGLYLNPPENALVLGVDEKPAIQAKDRLIPNKPLRTGSPEKMDFHYKRYGTQSLFAALSVHQGRIVAKSYDRHRTVEFLDFLSEIEQSFPQQEIYLIMDNLATHKHKDVTAWFEQRNNRFHPVFTPTHASWLNQIELWFSILSRKVITRGVFSSKQDLVQKIMNFIAEYNQTAKPFQWTYTGKPLTI
jgi:transposase